jgi:hypothetical protein
MSREFWTPMADLRAPCPHCGALVKFGIVFDWPSELGGDPVCDELQCMGCHRLWRVDNAPAEFSITLNGESYWNVVDLDVEA